MHWRQSRRGLMWQSFDTVPLIEDIPQLLPICKISSSTQHSYLIQYTYSINKANSTTTLQHYSYGDKQFINSSKINIRYIKESNVETLLYKIYCNCLLKICAILFVPCSTNLLKVHKIENFFGSEFEFYTISLLVMLKY